MSAAQAPAAGPVAATGSTPAPMRLTEDQLQRYSRHILLDNVGLDGQRRLLQSRVLIIGAGGLGSPVALYLAAAGVGTLGIVDGDRVDLSNLQRQILHYTHDVGRPKTQSARRTLEDINPDVRVQTHQTVLTSDNALEILAPYDVVVNGCDNFPTRYLVNDACVLLKKPLVDASILRWEGQATVFLPGRGCYRCLYPQPPPPGSVPSCAEGGIIGALAGHMGTLQAIETVKILLGVGDTLANRLLLFDGLTGEYTTVRWQRDAGCPVCGDHPTITGLIDYEEFCGVPGRHGASGAGAPAGAVVELAPSQARELVERERAEVQLIDVREPWEWQHARIPGAVLIPMGQVASRMGEIDPARPVVLICQSGVRSAQVAEWLQQAGYRKVYNLAGGVVAWANAGLPLEQG